MKPLGSKFGPKELHLCCCTASSCSYYHAAVNVLVIQALVISFIGCKMHDQFTVLKISLKTG